jgi:hypothetical protein
VTVPATPKATGFLKPALIATTVVGVIAAVVGGILQGAPGAIGAGAGVALVITSYVVSTLIIAWVDRVNRNMLLVVGMATYAVKFLLLFLFVGWVATQGWIGTKAMGIGVVAGVLAWTVAQIWWTSRAKFTLEV